jgi:hypothetical protein
LVEAELRIAWPIPAPKNASIAASFTVPRTIFGQRLADEEANAPAEQCSLSEDKIEIFNASNT